MVCKSEPYFSLLRWKHNEKEVAEEYCWATTHAGVRSYCGRSPSSDLGFGFKLDSHIYIYIYIHIYMLLNCQKECFGHSVYVT